MGESVAMLLGDRCYPTTSSIGFSELPLPEAVSACQQMWPAGRLRERRLTGTLEELLHRLLPLTTGRVRLLLVQTASRWTAYFDSSWRGTDVFPIIARLSEVGRCLGMRASVDTMGTIWTVYGADGNTRRHISATEEAPSSWEFRQEGDPYPFEDTTRYMASRIRDRLPTELLDGYLRQFDIDLFNESFYSGPAALLEVKLYRHLSLFPSRIPRIKEYASFAAAREARETRSLFYRSVVKSAAEADAGIQHQLAALREFGRRNKRP